jgi:hypothetical protein
MYNLPYAAEAGNFDQSRFALCRRVILSQRHEEIFISVSRKSLPKMLGLLASLSRGILRISGFAPAHIGSGLKA